jgi:hypothetical protein
MKSSFTQKIVRLSALSSDGRNLHNRLFGFWEKQGLQKFMLKLTDL